MKFGKYGVFCFTDTLNREQCAELAHRVDKLGYSTLWYPEVLDFEPFAIGAFLLGNSKSLIVGSGIANIYARDATTAVMGHNSLNRLYEDRFVLGLGVSHLPLVADLRGHSYDKPVTTMRAYLDRMDSAWQALGGASGERKVVLAALGPQMSKLAVERTLGAFPYNVTPQQAILARSAMGTRGALICEQKVCMTTDSGLARKIGRAALAFYLPLPNYNNNWFRLGFNESDLKDGGSDRLIDAMVLWGSADEIKAKLDSYLENGADQVVIQALRPDGQAGPDWTALEALAPD